MKEVLRKAIEGGWWPKFLNASYMDGGKFKKKTPKYASEELVQMSYVIPSIWLDPLFWKALGKMMGWEKTIDVYFKTKTGQTIHSAVLEGWQFHQMLFMESVGDGMDTEVFFKEILG